MKRGGDLAARIWGVILLSIGLWFFADVTLGFDMPRIPWRDLWPIALIGLGVLILGKSMRQRAS